MKKQTDCTFIHPCPNAGKYLHEKHEDVTKGEKCVLCEEQLTRYKSTIKKGAFLLIHPK